MPTARRSASSCARSSPERCGRTRSLPSRYSPTSSPTAIVTRKSARCRCRLCAEASRRGRCGRAPTLRPCRKLLSVSNDVAAELAGDRRRRARRAPRAAAVHDPPARQPADDRGRRRRTSPRRAPSSTSSSSSSRAATRSARDRRRRARRARPGRGHPRGLRGRRLAPPRQEDRAEDGQPEALRRRDPRRARSRSGSAPPAPARPTWRWRLRSRRSPTGRSAGSSSRAPRSRPASGSASSRAHAREGRPVPAAPVRRALRHARRRPAGRVHGEGHVEVAPLAFMRGRTLNDSLHHPRRGAEHEPGADADVPDAARLRVEGRRHRRRHAGRPPARAGLRARSRCRTSSVSLDGVAFIRFGHEDVVRHKLVQRIVEAYRRHAEETGTRASEVTRGDVEIANRSGAEVDEPAAGSSRAACSRPRGSRTASSASSSSRRTRCRG